MQIQVTFEAGSYQELLDKIFTFLDADGNRVPAPTAKRTRRSKKSEAPATGRGAAGEVVAEDPAKDAPQAAAPSAPSPVASDPDVTLDDVRAALAALMNRKNMDAVTDLLARYGVTRVGELDAQQYAAVIEESKQ